MFKKHGRGYRVDIVCFHQDRSRFPNSHGIGAGLFGKRRRCLPGL